MNVFFPLIIRITILVFAACIISGCDFWKKSPLPKVPESQRVSVSNDVITNLEAPIPPQCYTKTESRHNPCYTCHQMYDRSTGKFRMNELDDGGLQGTYIFSDEGLSNHWSNIFVDRQEWVNSINDEEIALYVNQDNYSDLAKRMQQQQWSGFIPDLKNYHLAQEAFDVNGFAKDGSHWVAFNYKPFPGTFWPTNGSTDDVVIRLPKAFREIDGHYNQDIYLLNLLLVEMNIKQISDINLTVRNEAILNHDLDNDGQLLTANQLVQRNHYLGDAKNIPIIQQQYPAGTELMHSVRYLGIDEQGNIFIPKRMKELRYMKKTTVPTQDQISSVYAKERKEKVLGEVPDYADFGQLGFSNGMGWLIQGYIEDYDGNLRPQSYEENYYCLGCHAAVGATIDHTFAFARKVPGEPGFGYINLRGMPDVPSISEPGGEIAQYLQRAGGGSEFRENPEMLERWFTREGRVDQEKIAAADVYTLITPSKERARKLNKAYTHIVRHQSYIYGRDATWIPAKNVFDTIDESAPPLAAEFRFYNWDIRLDWNQP